jgi:IQ and AAA domain-containing protein
VHIKLDHVTPSFELHVTSAGYLGAPYTPCTASIWHTRAHGSWAPLPCQRHGKDRGDHGVQEVKALEPGERVLVVGASSEPYLCAKKDESALIGYFQKHLYVPLPDYAARQIIWPGLVAKYEAPVDTGFDWATLAQISANYSSGQLDKAVASLLSEPRLERLRTKGREGALEMREFINWLALLDPISGEVDEQIRKFADKTPARAALAAAGDKKKKGEKGDKPSSGKKAKGAKKGKK